MEGLGSLAAALGLERRAMLSQTERIVHGTTVATNALLERKGARVGLLTTEGHRDILEMREGLKDDRYNLRQPPPEPLVPRDRRLGVQRAPSRRRAGRDAAGPPTRWPRRSPSWRASGSRRSPSATCTRTATTGTSGDGRSTAGGDAHGVYVSLSSEVFPQIKEYERVCTTVVNAYVGPALERYLGRLATRLREEGYVARC